MEVCAEEEVDKYKQELFPILGGNAIIDLKKTVAAIAEDKGFDEALAIWNTHEAGLNIIKASKRTT